MINKTSELSSSELLPICIEEVLDEYLNFLKRIQEISESIEEFSRNLKSLSREIQHLEEYLIEIKMIPIGKLFEEVFHKVKEMAEESGKVIEIEVKGAEIKIDPSIFEALSQPFFYILRNIVQQGIEKPVGYIKINAKKKGRDIVIKIKNNLFPPEFSISDEMDFSTVKKTISKLRGTVEIFSENDEETTFTIKIPQSLDVSILLIFRSLNLEFAVPITHIERIVSAEDFPNLKDEKMINHRNRVIPVKYFSEIFLQQTDKIDEKSYIIIFNMFGTRKGLLVEDILGYEEVVIQSFGKFLEGLNQYSGYYVSAEGIPRYVINPLRIFEEGI